jgi:hypothetical protein
MPRLDRPKQGERISYEWGCAVVDALNELMTSPKVMSPLVVTHGAIGLGEEYRIRKVMTTTTITARSGAAYGTGQVKFLVDDGTTLSDAPGTNIVRDVKSILGNTVGSGKYGYVAWVDGLWHLIAADCA